VLELVDADWNGAIGAHEQSGVRCHRATGRDLVEIDHVDAVRGCTGSQQSALADGAGTCQDNDRLLLEKLTDDGCEVPFDQARAFRSHTHLLGAREDQGSLCRIDRPEIPKSSGLFCQIGRTFVRRIGCYPGCPETAAGTEGTGRAACRADGYQALRIAESCAAQDARRPALLELVADMAARDRRRTLPALHDFARRLGVPA
jgi:hypothetical protein